MTILGDYWRGRADAIPSSALVALLAEFGVSLTGARSALSRVTRRRLLARSREGRRTFYRLTPGALRQIDAGAERIFTFGTGREEWDGRWSLLAFSVAEPDRHLRHQLRNSIRFLGFAPLYDGLWIAPSDRTESVTRLLTELGIERFTLFRAEPAPGSLATLESAWDLDSLRAAYEAFIARFMPVRERLAGERREPSQALVDRTYLMDAWRAFPRLDPDLPDSLLPGDWPRSKAKDLFSETYEGLAPAARARFEELLDRATRGG